MKKLNLLILTSLVALMSSCGGSSNDVVTGAGATFPLPFYNMAFKAYQETTQTPVSYGGVGSGGGVRSLKDQIVDFAGSDAYLSDKELSDMPSDVIHVPTCMGAVVLAYNLPSVENLVLDGETVADIFLGNITRWNDPRIQVLNEGVSLPDMAISTVYRSDGSGTTFVFSDYLTKVSTQWAETMGTSKALKWNTGIAAKGNPGVAGIIKQSEGSIGYVGSEYGFSLNIPTATMKNSAGNLVKPTTESISAAASAEIPADMRTMITNSPASDAYPISCFTWIVIYKEQNYNKRSIENARETVALVKWMLGSEAQAMTTQVHYCPLSQSVVDGAMKLLDGVTFDGNKL
ncbi:MAG: phosphate ABC transporter substrate-binding protein PstS [Rikenellaceae bacterium]